MVIGKLFGNIRQDYRMHVQQGRSSE